MRYELVPNNIFARKARASKRREAIYGLATGCIPLIGFALFGFIPLIVSIVVAFNKPKGYSLEGMTFVGWQNFQYILGDPLFWKSVGNTMLNCLVTPLCMIVGLVIALLVSNSKLKGRTFFKSVFFLPYVCSVVATSIVWKFILDQNYGLLNQLLGVFNIPGQDWLGNPKLIMPTMIFLGVWSGSGFSVIMYSAALTTVDHGVVEASYIDGASRWSRFWNVTFPAVMPITFFLFVTGIIGNLQDFSRFEVMLGAGGGANNAGMTVGLYLYTKGFQEILTFGMGYASACSWILTILIMTITAGQFIANQRSLRK